MQALLPGRSRNAIIRRANTLGVRLRKPDHNWIPDDVCRLTKMYDDATNDDLEKAFPGMRAHAIRAYANKRGMRCQLTNQRKGTLTPLLENTLTAFYWAGFIAADGHVTKKGQVVVMLDKLDHQHLQKLADFLQTRVNYPYENNQGKTLKCKKEMCRVAVADKKLGIEFARKFDFSHRKTYEPPATKMMDEWSENQASAFLAGFIDGDDSCNACCAFTIEVHGAWREFLSALLNKCGIQKEFALSTNGTAKCYLGFKTCRDFMDCVIRSGVPVLERKWNKIRMKLEEI